MRPLGLLSSWNCVASLNRIWNFNYSFPIDLAANGIPFGVLTQKIESWAKRDGNFFYLTSPETSLLTSYRELFSESCQSEPNLECNHSFPIDLAPNGIPFGAKSIGSVIRIQICLDYQDFEKISLCDKISIKGTFNSHSHDLRTKNLDVKIPFFIIHTEK